jgi:CheY-like chemotaxis protein
MKTILLVEDDKFIRDLVSIKLIENGFLIDIAESGEEALVNLRDKKPDLMVLDLELNGMQGVDLLAVLKSDSLPKPVPVVVFSNNDEPEMKEKCAEFGVEDFFLKINTDLNALIASIQGHLS